MPTIKELRLEAGLSIAKLSNLADIDRKTVERAENGLPIRDVQAYKLVSTLAKKLGRELSLDQVEDLHIL